MVRSDNQLRVYLLGEFRIERDSKWIHLPTRKTRALFAYLILNPDAHSREELAATFWGDSPYEKARGSLRKALTHLRQNLGTEIILADRESIQVNPAISMWVDVFVFQRQARNYLANPYPDISCVDFDLYQDDLLVSFYDDWIQPRREAIRENYLEMLLRVVEQLRAQSEYQIAIDYAQRILSIDPTHEIAHQHLMFCSITMGDRIRALKQYEVCEQALKTHLAVEPSRQTKALYSWLRKTSEDTPSYAARLTNLPFPISSFVGRQRELAEIKLTLSSARLLTLTGIGGCGKTRLAIQTAIYHLDAFQDGVWWVDLVPLTDVSLVTPAIAKVFGVREQNGWSLDEILVYYLSSKQLLLVLDNCEHLIKGVAEFVEQILHECPDLKILATSRESLGIAGEYVWLVPPLSIPDGIWGVLKSALIQFGGVRLFIERAGEVHPGFALTETNAASVVKICQQLDGIPLAIELAAARTNMIPVEQIDAQLAECLDLGKIADRTVHPRHKTLRATIDWSYNLLSEAEAELFQRLSIFADGWTLLAAESICTGAGLSREDIFGLLAQLLSKSVIDIDPDSQRYSMLATIRQYADEKLAQSGMQTLIIKQYIEYFLEFAETADRMIRGPEQFMWLRRLDQEHENMTDAINNAFNMDGGLESGIQIINCLHHYWMKRGNTILNYWMERASTRITELGRNPTRAEFLCLYAGGSVLGFKRWLEPYQAHAMLLESLDIWEELGPQFQVEKARCLVPLGKSQIRHIHEGDGFESFDRAIEILENEGATWWHAWALINLANELDPEDKHTYQRVLQKEMELWAETGDQYGQAFPLDGLGWLALYHGDYKAAQNYIQKGLTLIKKFGSTGVIHQMLTSLGEAAQGLGELDQAEVYFQESLDLAKEYGSFPFFALNYFGLGSVELLRGNDKQAELYFRKALLGAAEYEINPVIVVSIAGLAATAVLREKYVEAARLFGVYHSRRESYLSASGKGNLPFSPSHRDQIDQYLERCRAKLETDIFDSSWNKGYRLTLADLLEEVQ